MVFGENTEFTENIFLLANNRIIRELDMPAFDGLVSRKMCETAYGGKRCEAAYVKSDSTNAITHAVLFLIDFDDKGYIKENWRDLPLDDLAARAGDGPDLGSGPIKLACRSQCCINWHVNSLWDPAGGKNDPIFQSLKNAMAKSDMGIEKTLSSFIGKIPEILNTPIPIEKIPEILNTPIEMEKVQLLVRKNIEVVKDRYASREKKLIAKYQIKIKDLSDENRRLKMAYQKVALQLEAQDKPGQSVRHS